MRVLVGIFEQLVPISGGGTPRISSIINAFVNNGHDVSVAASFATDVESALRILNCEQIFPLKNISRLDKDKMKKYLFFHPLNVSKVVKEAMKLKPDLIITHNSIAGLAGLISKKLTHSLSVVDMTDLIFEYLSYYDGQSWASQLQRFGEKGENYVISKSDKIITISHAMKSILIQKGAETKKVDVVYDGVQTDIFKPRRKKAATLRQKIAEGVENVVMHHGVIDPQDQPEIIVDAAVEVVKEHPNTMFWLIGDGSAIPSIKEQIKKNELEKNFFISGWIPFEEVPTFISACDIGLVTLPDISSARIRVTLKAFEYWACEKPVVASGLPALKEIVIPGRTGLLYKPENPEDLAKKICILLEDKNMSKNMGRVGGEVVRKRYSWNELATEFMTICESMI